MKTEKSVRKIGYILKKFPVLSETFILNEILGLEERGMEVHIFSLERPNDPRFHENVVKLKAPISYVPDINDMQTLWKHQKRASEKFGSAYGRALRYTLKYYNRPSLFWRFLQACYIANEASKYKVQHLHAHFATRPTTAAFFASMLSGIPYSFTAHAMDIFKGYLSPKALAKKIDRARFVITISDYNKRFLMNQIRPSSEQIHRIYNGIDLNYFHANGHEKRDKFTFICVARFVEKKGHPILLEACAHLRDQGIPFECWLIGKGKLRSRIEEQRKDLKLQDHVKLLGALRQGEVLEHYHRAHALVLPCIEGSDGNKDGLPVSITEALACGIPVITTPMTGCPEVVRDGENGYLVQSGDSRAMAEAMRHMASITPWEYRKMKEAARRSVETNFDRQKTLDQIQQLFMAGTHEN